MPRVKRRPLAIGLDLLTLAWHPVGGGESTAVRWCFGSSACGSRCGRQGVCCSGWHLRSSFAALTTRGIGPFGTHCHGRTVPAVRRPGGSRRRSRLRCIAGVLAVLTHTQLSHPFSVPDLATAVHDVANGMGSASARHEPLHLFDGNIFYPQRFTLAFSDPMILPR
jgi:hypothetical protein